MLHHNVTDPAELARMIRGTDPDAFHQVLEDLLEALGPHLHEYRETFQKEQAEADAKATAEAAKG